MWFDKSSIGVATILLIFSVTQFVEGILCDASSISGEVYTCGIPVKVGESIGALVAISVAFFSSAVFARVISSDNASCKSFISDPASLTLLEILVTVLDKVLRAVLVSLISFSSEVSFSVARLTSVVKSLETLVTESLILYSDSLALSTSLVIAVSVALIRSTAESN